MDHSLGALLAQQNDKGYEVALYYLSRVLIGAENNYTLVEKECLALMFEVDKLRHCIIVHNVQLISQINPIRILMMKASFLNSRLAKWAFFPS